MSGKDRGITAYVTNGYEANQIWQNIRAALFVKDFMCKLCCQGFFRLLLELLLKLLGFLPQNAILSSAGRWGWIPSKLEEINTSSTVLHRAFSKPKMQFCLMEQAGETRATSGR